MRSRFIAPLAALFDLMLWPWRRLHLSGVHIAGATADDMPEQTALLLVANHVSWWDGFLLRDVQKRLRPGSALLTVMSEPQLARFPFLRWLGVIGIDSQSLTSTRAMLETLGEWRAKRRSRLVVSYFAQGRIWPSSRRPLGFERGVSVVASRLAPVSVIPIALHLEPLASPSPHAFVLVGEPIVFLNGSPDVAQIERAVALLLDELRVFLDRAGEDAAEHWRDVRKLK
ncbi:MAG TPA: lysophospholipid acyltransferase family protein [Gemmatimonadaceae bacterium]